MSCIDNSTRPVIAVDFDGTLCDHKFPDIGAVKPGAKEALTCFRNLGYLILIYSCRTCHWHYDLFGGEGIPVMERPTVVAMKAFLDANEIPYDEIDDGSKGKPLADYLIDDRAIRFENNWPQITTMITIQTLIKESNKLKKEINRINED